MDPQQLIRLKSLGLDMVELGIQSFDDNTLSASRRGYTASQAEHGCAMVRDAGLELGIQLMPGMPGSSPAAFLQDVETTISMFPSQVRLYPCQVIASTGLERLWREGRYVPWSLETTITLLTLAVSRLWSRSTRVIRMGLAPEQELERLRLAGPWHPALGFLVRSRVLAAHIACRVLGMEDRPTKLLVPERFLSEVIGHHGDRLPLLRRLGINRKSISCHSGELFYII